MNAATRPQTLARETAPDLATEFALFADRLHKFGADVEQLSADHRAAYAKFGVK